MKTLLSWYSPNLPTRLVYMIQQVDYRPHKFILWLKRWPNLNNVMNRRQLDKTKKAKLLLLASSVVLIASVITGLVLLLAESTIALKVAGILLLAGAPFITVLALCVTVYVAHIFIVAPEEVKLVKESKRIFRVHPAVKIGVAGSYGKTTFKEILHTVLSEKYNVATTPGNMNTPIAHARFASKLDGDEEVLIIEYGEEKPGDIEKFINVTKPDYGVLLGLAPNHLDYYKTLDSLAKDLLALRKLGKKLYINGSSPLLKKYLKKDDNIFTGSRAEGWKISGVKITLDGTEFNLKDGKREINVKSGMIGRHFVAPLSMAAVLASELGLSQKQIATGLGKTKPFEHRMQPRHLGGATILDDTYNGNVEGILAGLELLKELKAKRKIYVTPGLVDQGKETKAVHYQIAKKLFDVKPDLVVLMDNSATRIIEEALAKLGYNGLIKVEADPLNFYKNLDKVVAAGDLLMMQNDWTDNYN